MQCPCSLLTLRHHNQFVCDDDDDDEEEEEEDTWNSVACTAHNSCTVTADISEATTDFSLSFYYHY